MKQHKKYLDNHAFLTWKPAESICNRLPVFILQHPQEPHHPLSSGLLIEKILPNAHRIVGLSWPNLSKAFNVTSNASTFVTLYLGPKMLIPHPYAFIAKDKSLLLKPNGGVAGLIVLDGTWSQAKTLWWRNPWLLKTQRLILNPSAPSLYGSMRKEPHPKCLSSVEATAHALNILGEPESLKQSMLLAFQRFLEVASSHLRDEK